MAKTLWNHEVALSRDLVHSVVTPDNNRGHPVFYDDWSLHGYLQLGGEDWYTSRLTVYCHENSISGILSHSEPTQMIGVSDGHPIHFALRPDERITGVWAMTHIPEQQGAIYRPPITLPCLLVREITVTPQRHYAPLALQDNQLTHVGLQIATSLGRSKYFGEHAQTGPRPRQWTPLIRRGAIAMGLYFDGSSSVSTTAVPANIPSRFNRLKTSVGLRPPISHRPGNGVVFASYATLTATRSLKAYMDGDMYAGLLIEHDNGTCETLGCWDAFGKGGIRTIYEVGDGPLMRLAFRHSEIEGVTRVVEITPVIGDASVPDGDVTVCVLVSPSLFQSYLLNPGLANPLPRKLFGGSGHRETA